MEQQKKIKIDDYIIYYVCQFQVNISVKFKVNININKHARIWTVSSENGGIALNVKLL